MDLPILNVKSPNAGSKSGSTSTSGGPFSPPAFTATALSQLHEQAESLTARDYPPDEIVLALTKTAELWRARGAQLPDDIIHSIVPSVVTDAFRVEYVRRAYLLAAWLYAHAETVVAGLIVEAATAILLSLDEEENAPC
jgi:hypothetical protein